jgi:hypothetical protein
MVDVRDTACQMTPAQQRVWHGLLAVGRPRPLADPDRAGELRSRLEAATADAAALVPDGACLWLNKSALAALECDGRFLDREATPFVWSAASVRGQLAHIAIEIDTAGGRRRGVDEVLAFAWEQLASRPDGAGAFLARLAGLEVDALRAAVRKLVLTFRECFPLLPPEAHARSEVPFTVTLHGGRIVLKGVPDLVVGRATATHRRMQLIDVKTGTRRPGHRDDLRLYALLATCKLGVAPFRVATYYLDEADWDHEDVDESVLEAAVRAVVAKVQRAAELRFRPPRDGALRLVPGPDCRWCGRAPSCLARVMARERGELDDAPADRSDAA